LDPPLSGIEFYSPYYFKRYTLSIEANKTLHDQLL
jgi:hypothetical protein